MPNHRTVVPSAAQSGIVQIDAGGSHTCAVNDAGAVTCWGNFVSGQTNVPIGLGNIQQVSAGGFHTCALSTTGTVTCWGLNDLGQQTVPTPPSTWTRVYPTATFGAPTAPVIGGQSFTLTLTDPQVPGYTSTFTYAFDCGGGFYNSTATGSASCPTSMAGGVLTVRGKVIDAHGDATEYTASVTVSFSDVPVVPILTPVQATIALRTAVNAATLAPDLRRALTAKLDDAIKALQAGKTKSACSALGDFAKQVKAQRGKAIPTTTAEAWLAETALIRTAAGC